MSEFRDQAARLHALGYRTIPRYANGIPAKFGDGQNYAPDAPEWDNAIAASIALDNLILVDDDSHKYDRGTPASVNDVIDSLGIKNLKDAKFQRTKSGQGGKQSRHFLFMRTDDVQKASADNAFEGWDFKTGNQLAHLKPETKHLFERPVGDWPAAPKKMLDLFKRPEREAPTTPPKAATPPPGACISEFDDTRRMLAGVTVNSRDEWLKVLAGVYSKHGTEGLSLVDEWSAGQYGYKDSRDVEACYNSVADWGVTFGTVVHMSQADAGETFREARKEAKNADNVVPMKIAEPTQQVVSGSDCIFDNAVKNYPAALQRQDDLSEFGLATFMARQFKHTLKTRDNAQWMIWEDGRWTLDVAKAHMNIVKKALHQFDPKDVPHQKSLLTNVLTLMASEDGIRCKSTDFDSVGHILNTPKGIVDLRDGSIHERTHADLVAKVSGCSPEPGDTPLFDQFMREIFPDKEYDSPEEAQAIREFVLRVLALGLSGERLVQRFFYMQGAGANGKSVLLSVLEKILGEYSVRLNSSVLMRSNGFDTAKQYGIATLEGARLACASEVQKGDRWDESLIKEITGEPHMQVRQIYRTPTRINLQASLIIAGNHRPRFDGADGGMGRRVVFIHFKSIIPKSQQVKDIDDILFNAEGPQILHKLMQSLQDVRKNGLQIPESVEAETVAYINENDDIACFVEDVMEQKEGGFVPTSELYQLFKAWKEGNGSRPSDIKIFLQELNKCIGVEKVRRRINGESNKTWIIEGWKVTKKLEDLIEDFKLKKALQKGF